MINSTLSLLFFLKTPFLSSHFPSYPNKSFFKVSQKQQVALLMSNNFINGHSVLSRQDFFPSLKRTNPKWKKNFFWTFPIGDCPRRKDGGRRSVPVGATSSLTRPLFFGSFWAHCFSVDWGERGYCVLVVRWLIIK